MIFRVVVYACSVLYHFSVSIDFCLLNAFVLVSLAPVIRLVLAEEFGNVIDSLKVIAMVARVDKADVHLIQKIIKVTGLHGWFCRSTPCLAQHLTC